MITVFLMVLLLAAPFAIVLRKKVKWKKRSKIVLLFLWIPLYCVIAIGLYFFNMNVRHVGDLLIQPYYEHYVSFNFEKSVEIPLPPFTTRISRDSPGEAFYATSTSRKGVENFYRTLDKAVVRKKENTQTSYRYSANNKVIRLYVVYEDYEYIVEIIDRSFFDGISYIRVYPADKSYHYDDIPVSSQISP